MNRIDRMDPQDLMMIWPEERGWAQDIGALLILDGTALLGPEGEFPIDRIRDAVGRRLHLVPRFRQVLFWPRLGLGWPMWVDASEIDLAAHVRVQTLSPAADEEALLTACEQLRARRWDQRRPLWEMTFLTGLPEDRLAMFVRVHHAIADGMAGITALGAFVDGDADPPVSSMPAWSPAQRPRAFELFVDNIRSRCHDLSGKLRKLAHPLELAGQIRGGWPALREAFFEGRAPATSLNRPVGWHRRFAFIPGDLDAVKRAAHDHGAKVNDVLLTGLAGGLRALMVARGEPVDGVVLRAAVPVALHDPRARAEGNRDGMMMVPLPVGEADDERRLELIGAETARRKRKRYVPGGALLRNGVIQRVVLRGMARQRLVNTYAADVPGPPTRLFFAGAPILEMFPIVPIQGNISIGVGALSYAGQFNITVVADRDQVPDLSILIRALRSSLRTVTADSHPRLLVNVSR